MPRVGRFNKWVTLSRCPQHTNDTDGFFEPLSPAGAWAAIRPLPPSLDGRTIQHEVGMRFHPQVNMDTRIVFDTRELFVKGFQNINEDDAELRLLCEEIIP
jgi:head-tail adaptor